MPFEQLGPYRLGRLLGRGGMGSVYAATREDTGESAAVKVLSASASHTGLRERFSGEIESLRMLVHPNIVRLLGFGEQDGVMFYAMELVEGKCLEQELLAGRRFDWREVLAMGVQILKALKHAHDRGVIHRDIKPANLLLTPDGVVKLSDFGISKMFGSPGLTGDGGMLGTAEYMAPEQCDGKPVNHRCDLYSLGGVLYALLAGRPPFQASSLPEMLQLQRFAEPEPVRRFAPETPLELEAVIAQLLRKNPEDRVPTATALARRFEAMKAGLARAPETQATDALSTGTPASGAPATATPAPDTDFALSPSGAPAPMLAPASVRAASPDSGADQRETMLAEDYPLALPAVGGAEADDFRAARSELNLASDLRAAAPSPSAESVASARPLSPRLPLENGPRVAPAPGAFGLAAPRPPQLDKFVTVDAEEQRRRERHIDSVPHWLTWQTVALAAGLLAIGGAAWYFTRPASADQRYREIAEAASGSDDQLSGAEDRILGFLSDFPDDPRRDEVLEYKDKIETRRLERRFELIARSLSQRAALGPIEQAYAEALAQSQLDAEQGLAELTAFIELFGESHEDHACLELARRQIERLKKQLDENKLERVKLIEARLDRAAELASEDPSAARRIWRAIVTTYGGKPWAEDLVDRATRALRADDEDISRR